MSLDEAIAVVDCRRDRPWANRRLCRALTRIRQPATKDWADSYLAAFAAVGQLTLVTFDRGLRMKLKSVVVLG
jgi:predicted nucleic acid-binding protein